MKYVEVLQAMQQIIFMIYMIYVSSPRQRDGIIQNQDTMRLQNLTTLDLL